MKYLKNNLRKNSLLNLHPYIQTKGLSTVANHISAKKNLKVHHRIFNI